MMKKHKVRWVWIDGKRYRIRSERSASDVERGYASYLEFVPNSKMTMYEWAVVHSLIDRNPTILEAKLP